MKRFLLLPILIFGLSLACDQPYEEVAGIKIGCSVSSVSDIGLFSTNNAGTNGLRSQSKVYGGELFGTISIMIHNGTVVGLYLEDVDGAFSPKDIKDLTSQLNKRWGGSSTYNDGEMAGRIYSKTNNNIISRVEVSTSDNLDYVQVMYLTDAASKLVDEIRKEQMEWENNRFKDL